MLTGVGKTRRMNVDEGEMRIDEGPVNEIEVPVKACENSSKIGDDRKSSAEKIQKKRKSSGFSSDQID